MLKRATAIVTVRDGWVVNSYGFGQWLPIGSLRHTLERLEHWQVDEICVLDISKGRSGQGFDPVVVSLASQLGLSTPMTYGGGIRTAVEAAAAVRLGVERVVLGASAYHHPEIVREVGCLVGEQATVVSVPIVRSEEGLRWLEPSTGRCSDISEVQSVIPDGWRGEILVQNVATDGRQATAGNFLELVPHLPNVDLMVAGGISEPNTVRQLLKCSQVRSVAVGVQMHAKELFSPRLKQHLDEPLRAYKIQRLENV